MEVLCLRKFHHTNAMVRNSVSTNQNMKCGILRRLLRTFDVLFPLLALIGLPINLLYVSPIRNSVYCLISSSWWNVFA